MMFVAGMSMTGCNDFLDDNRWPLDQQTDTPEYWNNVVNVQAQTNTLYGYYLGYGNGTSWVNNFYYRSLNDDQCAKMESGSGVVFADWNYQYAPETNGVWDDSYVAVRKCNTIVTRLSESTLGDVVKNNYIGIARLNRAYQYWDLVRSFGDVPLIEGVLDVNSPELYMPRTPRNTVMDYVLEDLNFAVNNITQQSNKLEFSKDMANAMKAQICLFEASYAKYHQNDNTRAQKYYNEVITACRALMGSYSLCSDYRSLYNSMWDELQTNPEIIFMKGYIAGTMGHSMIKYLSSNTPICGMTKDAFDAYLFKDGKPKALTSENNSDAAVLDADGNLCIQSLLDVRDKRLEATIDPYLAFNGNMWKRDNSDPLSSVTGYTIRKFVNPATSFNENTNDGSNAVCAPIFWLAEIYLNYAEARAELGQFDDADMNATLNKLYARAGLPSNRTVAELSNMNDPANNMGVSSLLWEIRRCRRCELMFDNYIRYWDLVRWHKLDLLGTNTNPSNAIYLGANVSNAKPDQLKGIQVTDGYINAAKSSNGTSTRNFTEREYFFPVGTKIIDLYKQYYDQKNEDNPLKQNPGW